MKIGFSFGRCIRDIVNGTVSIDDVAFIIAATAIRSKDQLAEVVQAYQYRSDYLAGLDETVCLEIANTLWDQSKILQPRLQGLHRHMQPESSIWVDMYPTAASENPSVKTAWDAYRCMLHMTETVDPDALENFQ